MMGKIKLAITLREYFIQHQEIAQQWSKSNSDDLLDLTIGSNKKVLWNCMKHNIDYQTSIYRKIKSPQSCSVCNGSKVYKGINDVATVRPDLVKEWSAKNDKIPQEVKYTSSQKIIWECANEHEWKTALYHRTQHNSGCKICKDNERMSRDADKEGLIKNHPQMKKHFIGYVEEIGYDLSIKSQKQCRWKCEFGHTWETAPKYYQGCQICSGKKVIYNNIEYNQPELSIIDNQELLKLYDDNNKIPAQFVPLNSAKKVNWKCIKGHKWSTQVYALNRSISKGYSGCPQCANIISFSEKEIVNFVQDNLSNTEILLNNRKTIAPYELDIYIPEKNIAIEYNGLYWHSNARVSVGYHRDKYRACLDKGIQLITIWEDDWIYRQQITKNMVLTKLGLSEKEKLNARAMEIVRTDKIIVDNFFNNNHIQGTTTYSVTYGLIDNFGSLRAVMAFKRRKKGVWELVRYATNAIVRGGFSKILKHFEIDYQPDTIISFADLMVSNGNLYEKNGFTNDKIIKPSYMYVIDNHRVHKFNYRLKRFQNDPALKFEDGLSESQLAELNGLLRVYDAGKIRYIKNYI